MLLTLAPLLITCGLMFAVQPVRKPYIELSVNGEKLLDEDILEVDRGNLVKITLSFEGGRRDYVEFPDSYADIPNEAQIVSRNENRLVYQIQNEKYEWELLDQSFEIETDEKIKIRNKKTQGNEHQLWINIPSRKVNDPYIKFSVKASWQYTEGTLIMQEEDVAEAILHLKIKGKTDEWFVSPNIKVSGNEDGRLEEKFTQIQNSYYNIEEKMIKRDFNSAQVEIRNLKTTIQQTDLLLKQIKNENETFFADITFVGLPSDKPIGDIEKLRELINYWTELNPMLKLHQNNFDKIPIQPTNDNKKDVLTIAQVFDNWFHSLPENGIDLLNTYIPEINWEEKVSIHPYLSFNPEHNRVNNVSLGYEEVDEFLYRRSFDVPMEIQKINIAVNRLQATRLFDGMLRGFISSIKFSSWENTRTNNLVTY